MNTSKFQAIAHAVLLGSLLQAHAQGLEPKTFVGTRLSGERLFAMDLVPGADLRGVTFKPGVRLRGARLKGADLGGAVLDGVDLRGADLAGANFAEASLLGALLDAPLDPAKVHLLNTLAPQGLLLNPAGPPVLGAPHPALPPPEPLPKVRPKGPRPSAEGEEKTDPGAAPRFRQAPADASTFFERNQPRGAMRLLVLDEDAPVPKRLVPCYGGLGWIGEDAASFNAFMPYGLRRLPLGFPPQDLAWNGRTLAFTGPEGHFVLWCDGQDPAKLVAGKKPLDPPGSVALTDRHLATFRPAQDKLTLTPLGVLRTGRGRKGATTLVTVPPQGDPGEGAFLGLVRGPGELLLVHRRNAFRFLDPDRPGWSPNLPLPPDPDRKVLLTRTQVWFTTPRGGELLAFNLTTQETSRYFHEELAAPIAGLAETADGALWFTQPQANRLCRIEPRSGDTQEFLVPIPGSRPTLLIDGGDGNLYFTMAGKRRLGCISAGLQEPLPQAAAPLQPERKDPAPPPSGSAAAGAAAAPPPPARTVAAALDHILAEHRFDAPTFKGQFTQADSTPARVQALVDGAVTRADLPPVLDMSGRWLAYKDFGRTVGYWYDRSKDHWTPTSLLKVVLSPRRDFVITAYPVKDF